MNTETESGQTEASKKLPTGKELREIRRKMNLNQAEFWNRIGTTQSAGSRYESGRDVPESVASLAYLVYITGYKFDARDFK